MLALHRIDTQQLMHMSRLQNSFRPEKLQALYLNLNVNYSHPHELLLRGGSRGCGVSAAGILLLQIRHLLPKTLILDVQIRLG